MDEIVKRSLKGVVQTLVDRLLFFAVLRMGLLLRRSVSKLYAWRLCNIAHFLEIEGMKRDALRDVRLCFIAQTRTGIQSSLIDRKRGPL